MSYFISMKKNNRAVSIFLFVCALVVFFAVGMTAVFATDVLPESTTSATQLAWQKQILSNLADVAINKIKAAKNALQTNPQITPATKQTAIASLQGVEDQLVSYKSQVAQATTLQEVQALNQQFLQYIQANKDVIINAFKAVLADIGTAATAKAKAFEAQLRQTLKLLKVICPTQAATIVILETQLDTLKTDIAALSVAITAKNLVTIKLKINEINTLIQSMSVNVKTIQAACGIPS